MAKKIHILSREDVAQGGGKLLPPARAAHVEHLMHAGAAINDVLIPTAAASHQQP
jgi:hypothetical protein